VSPVHFAERHALVLIVVLGEAVVALGGKAVASELHVAGIAGLLGGFALVATLWWSYFAWNVEAGERWLRGHGRPFAPGDVGAAARMARDAFTFGHFPLVAGLIAVAVALKDLAQAPLEPWSGAARAALGAGLVLYLGGHAAVVWRGNGHVLHERLAVVPVLAATVAFSPLPAGATAILLAVELLVALLLEGRRWRRVLTPGAAAA
jgi:low temperature requirement protein LtrA